MVQINLFLIFILIMALKNHYTCKKEVGKIKYKWVDEYRNFDFIVGISIKNKPVCTGAIINPYLVITAANPFHYRIPHAVALNNRHDVKCHTIETSWEKSNFSEVVCIEYQYRSHKVRWNPLGLDPKKMHSPRHDCAVLTLKYNLSDVILTPNVRYPYFTRIKNNVEISSYGSFLIVGHGFMDKVHVKQNFELDYVEYKVESVWTDCEEWIPRTWGYFICVLNVDKFVGINSGAVLMYDGQLIGIGSFSLTKGDESIMLFTDIRVYLPGSLKYCKLAHSKYALKPRYNITL